MRNLTLQTLFALLLPIPLLLACVLFALFLPLPRPFPPPLSQGRNLLAALGTGLLGLAYLLALAAFLIRAIARAGQSLDPLLQPADLVSQPTLLFGRRYVGRIQGRDATVTFRPAPAPWPAQLDLYVGARLGLRAALAPRRPLLDCADCPRLHATPRGWEGPPIWTRDGAKVRRLLADPAVRAALADLPELYLQPERLWLRVRTRRLTEDQVRGWLDALLALAAHAERALTTDR